MGSFAVGTRGADKSVRASGQSQQAVREHSVFVGIPDGSHVDGCGSQQYERYDTVVVGGYVRFDKLGSQQQSFVRGASVVAGSVEGSGIAEGRGQQSPGQCPE